MMADLTLDMGCYKCNMSGRPELTTDVLEAAQEGNTEVIKSYLEEDGDVNALLEEESLLSRACANGQPEIVEILLRRQDVHLNMTFEEKTPLTRASEGGHLECVRLLIDASLGCNINLDNSLVAIGKCLKMQPHLQHRSAVHILKYAVVKGDWNVLESLLDTNHNFVKEDLSNIVNLAMEYNRWDIIRKILQRDFYGKKTVVNDVFATAVRLKDWEKAKETLVIMESNLNFEVEFVEAVFAGRFTDVQRLLERGEYNSGTANGNFLVASAVLIEDDIAELLLSVDNLYTKRTLSTALLLSARCRSAELLPRLIGKYGTSYSFSELVQAYEILTRNSSDGLLAVFFRSYLRKFYEV